MKVLIVIDSLEVGTPGQLLPTLAKAAPSEQVELEVVSLQPPSGKSGTTIRRLEELGVKPSFLGIRRISDLRSVQRVADTIRTSRCRSRPRPRPLFVDSGAGRSPPGRTTQCVHFVRPAATGRRSGRAQGAALRFGSWPKPGSDVRLRGCT